MADLLYVCGVGGAVPTPVVEPMAAGFVFTRERGRGYQILVQLEGLKQQQPWHGSLSQEMVATIISYALYGAAKEWILTPQRGSAEAIADGVVDLLVTMIHPPALTRS